jgi:phosphoribosylanthranilate isomerase
MSVHNRQIDITRVKICGITNSADAQLASEYGADAIGLVFYPPSPRFVTLKQAKEITRSLPPFLKVVALFVDAQREEIKTILAQVDIDLIQFHGKESSDFCASFSRPYVKAIRMQEGIDLFQFEKDYASARGLLLDTYKKGIPGGTGTAFNWQQIPEGLTKPIILAGGLEPENVGRAIQSVNPYAVDVSGGIEATHGIKDHNKLAEFMRLAGKLR